MTEQFFEDLPRSERRAKDDEHAAGDMNELVLPPAADMLSVDDLLISSAPSPAETPAPVSSADMLADLPPMPTIGDSHSPSTSDLHMAPAPLSVAPLDSTYSSINEPEVVRHNPAVSLEELTLVQADPEHVAFTEALPPVSQSNEAVAAAERNKPHSFFEKHKPKLIIGVLVLAVIGWNQYKKYKAETTAAAIAPVTQVAPYEAAIQNLQAGADNVSHLGATDPGAALDAAAAKSAGEELFNGSSDDDKLFTSSTQPSDVKAPIKAPVAEPATLTPASVVAPSDAALTVAPSPATSIELSAVKEQLALVSKDRDDWKHRALEAEKNLPKSRATEPTKTTVAPIVKPKKPVEKPVQKVVSTKPAAPAAQAPKADVQYLGSFLVQDNWHAHMIIGGNVYEVSSGQKIAGMSISNVSATGASVNGREYR